jgi:hypothetical protein
VIEQDAVPDASVGPAEQVSLPLSLKLSDAPGIGVVPSSVKTADTFVASWKSPVAFAGVTDVSSFVIVNGFETVAPPWESSPANVAVTVYGPGV